MTTEVATVVSVHVDRDYLGDNGMNRVGLERTVKAGSVSSTGKVVRFRTLSDDREPTYGGWLLDDDECRNQFWMLDFARADAGDTMIEVKRGNKWCMDIG